MSEGTVRISGRRGKARAVAWFACKAAVSIGLLVILLSKVSLSDAAGQLAQSQFAPTVAAIALLGVSLGLSAWRWHVASARLLPLPLCLHFTWIGHLYSLVLPGALSADVAKGAVLAGRNPDECRVTLATSIVLDRIAGLGMLVVLGMLACLLQADFLNVPAAGLIVTAGAAAAGLIALPWLLRQGAGRLPRLLPLAEAMHLRRWFGILALSALVHGVNITFYWASFMAVHGDRNWMGMGVYTSLLNLAMLLPVSIAGVGIREQLATWFLHGSNAGGPAVSIAFGMLVLMIFAVHAVIGLALQWWPRKRMSRSRGGQEVVKMSSRCCE